MADQAARGGTIQAARAFASAGHERIRPGRHPAQQAPEAHLKAVAQMVAEAGGDEDAVAASWLHDIAEETAVTIGEVERRFGKRVARLVAEVTPASGGRRQDSVARAEREAARLAELSREAKTIKLADLIDTLHDVQRADRASALAYANECGRLVQGLQGAHPRLLDRLCRELTRCAHPGSLPAAEKGEGTPRLVALPARALQAFRRAFAADDIAEPLLSFDEGCDGQAALRAMRAAGVEVAGVRSAGIVAGYVEAAELGEGPCGARLREIAAEQTVAADTDLLDVIEILTVHDWCFVTALGAVSAVVCRRDLQKPAARMWLFGIITVAELEATRRIAARWPGEAWTSLLSPGRVAKTRELFAERQRRKETCQLVDCLQLGDKIEILTSDRAELDALGLPSAAAARHVSKQVAGLRDRLAHAQPFVEEDWPQLVRLARRTAGLGR